LDGGTELVCYPDWTKREHLKFGNLRNQLDLNVHEDSNSFNDSKFWKFRIQQFLPSNCYNLFEKSVTIRGELF